MLKLLIWKKKKKRHKISAALNDKFHWDEKTETETTSYRYEKLHSLAIKRAPARLHSNSFAGTVT